MISLDIKIDINNLKQAIEVTQKNFIPRLNTAITKVGRILKREAQDITPVMTGRTQRAWQLKIWKGNKTTLVKWRLSNRRELIVDILDEGAVPHVIMPRRKKALRFTIEGEEFIRRRVNHPGIKPHFIQVKLLENADAQINEVIDKINDAIVRQWARKGTGYFPDIISYRGVKE